MAEFGSLSLEFTRLSQLTNDPKYYDAIARITDSLEAGQNTTRIPGLWPTTVNAAFSSYTSGDTFSMGSSSDSTYEYLPKQYLLLGGRVEQYKSMYKKALEAAKVHIFFPPMVNDGRDILLSGSVRVDVDYERTMSPRVEHLSCFTGGMVALGAKIFDNPEDMYLAERLTAGCLWMYGATATGIMPEIVSAVPCADKAGTKEKCPWEQKRWYEAIGADTVAATQRIIANEHLTPGISAINDRRFLLRPEAIESLFVLYRTTADRQWQEKGWEIFQNIQNYTRTSIANAGIKDVTSENTEKIDSMESFWLAETLKYFYLLFSEPDVISLDDWVLNTEAHPLRRPDYGRF
jgi:mannosyl-oligosaccharide alpha-1,2-mannosidase